jgi:hypothetical protein
LYETPLIQPPLSNKMKRVLDLHPIGDDLVIAALDGGPAHPIGDDRVAFLALQIGNRMTDGPRTISR